MANEIKLIGVAEIAKRLDMQPKVLRKRLRKYHADGKLSASMLTHVDAFWEFTPKAAADIVKLFKAA